MIDKDCAVLWARGALEHPTSTYVLDTETTGIGDYAEIVSIAIIDGNGKTLLNSLVKPNQAIPAEATRIHGITDALVAGAPTWAELWPEVRWWIHHCEHLISYNADFDWRMIARAVGELGEFVERPQTLECALLAYAAFFGEYDDRHKSWKWQKLPGGDHSALGDCRAVLDLLFEMAGPGVAPATGPVTAHQYQLRMAHHEITDRDGVKVKIS